MRRGPLGVTPQNGVFELATSAAGTRTTSSAARAGLLGLFGVLGTGVVISLSAAHTGALLPESARPIPRWLAGPLSNPGLSIAPAPLIAMFALMFVSYVVTLRHSDRLSPRAV